MTATLSTHVLDGIRGSHAAGVPVKLTGLGGSALPVLIFENTTGDDGRLVEEIDLSSFRPDDQYELTFDMDSYWGQLPPDQDSIRIVREIVVRLRMPVPNGRYHVPIISSPNSYSIWWPDISGEK